jgi:uncharacterized protein (TIGR02231 family)
MSTRVDADIDADIVAVTVYPGQARVTRRGSAAVQAGQQRVVIGGLPLALREDSVRVNGTGAGTVLGVDVTAEHHTTTPDAAVEELEQRRRSLRDRLSELADEDTVVSSREHLVGTLSQRAGVAFARALAAESAEVSRVAEVSDALAGQLSAVLASRRELAERRRVVELELAEVERMLAERSSARLPDRRAIAVDLDMASAGDIDLEVSYLVDAARWESRYDVRLRGDSLRLTWFGLITQSTGEDWPESDLRLSTARPASAVTVPELDPWYLQRFAPALPPARSMPGAAMEAYGAMDAVRAAPPPQAPAPARFAEATAAVEHGVAATTYQPAHRIAVPSDGTAHRTTITAAELPARLDHVTVPLRGPEAYLRATATNTSEHTLLPGPAAIFHDTEFVGTTGLEPWAPGEEVELALGVDDRVRVERELVKRAAGKAVLGGTKRHEAAYRITVGNYGPRTARVTVIDQIPVSRDDAITVREVHVDPKPVEQTDLGEVTWELTLEPNDTTELTLGFRVDVAKGVTLSGWRD